MMTAVEIDRELKAFERNLRDLMSKKKAEIEKECAKTVDIYYEIETVEFSTTLKRERIQTIKVSATINKTL